MTDDATVCRTSFDASIVTDILTNPYNMDSRRVHVTYFRSVTPGIYRVVTIIVTAQQEYRIAYIFLV